MFLIPLVLPHIFPMSERGVKDSSLAMFLGPRNGEVAELLLVIGMFVQDEQFVHFGGIVILDQINLLLFDAVGFTKMFDRRMVRVLHQAFDPDLRAVPCKLAPEHFDVWRKAMVSVVSVA